MGDNELATRACRPLPAGTAPLSGRDLERLLLHATAWAVVDGRLERTLRFPDHYRALAFVNAVAWISHREDHHPELVVGYDRVTVRYDTHSVGGLSDNDFICAAKVDQLVGD